MEKLIETKIAQVQALIRQTQQEASNLPYSGLRKLAKFQETRRVQLPLLTPEMLESRPTPSLSELPEPPTLFTFKRKISHFHSPSKKLKTSKESDADTQIEGEEAGFSNKETRFSWEKRVIELWVKQPAERIRENVFQPTYTPRNTKFLCDLSLIFPESKRQYGRRESEDWTTN